MDDFLKETECDLCKDEGLAEEVVFDEEGREMRGAGRLKKCVCRL